MLFRVVGLAALLLGVTNAGPCDIYEAAGTPCVAAHSPVRALYSKYNGALYQVKRESDGKTRDINVLEPGGIANAAAQDEFCDQTNCSFSIIYDQSGKGNDLTVCQGGGWVTYPDDPVNATQHPITIAGKKAYAMWFTFGMGYRVAKGNGVPVNDEPEAIYMVTSGKHYNFGCCFDYGNAETSGRDDGEGTMEALNIMGFGDSGAFVGVDIERTIVGLQCSGDECKTVPSLQGASYVTAMVKGHSGGTMAIKQANAQENKLYTKYDGARPDGVRAMRKEGAIVLGVGGDNTNTGEGCFYEGVIVKGDPDDSVDDKVQADIAAAGYVDPVTLPPPPVKLPTLHQQCGGKIYGGPKQCADGLDCVYQTEWKSECLPSTTTRPPTTAPPPTTRPPTTAPPTTAPPTTPPPTTAPPTTAPPTTHPPTTAPPTTAPPTTHPPTTAPPTTAPPTTHPPTTAPPTTRPPPTTAPVTTAPPTTRPPPTTAPPTTRPPPTTAPVTTAPPTTRPPPTTAPVTSSPVPTWPPNPWTHPPNPWTHPPNPWTPPPNPWTHPPNPWTHPPNPWTHPPNPWTPPPNPWTHPPNPWTPPPNPWTHPPNPWTYPPNPWTHPPKPCTHPPKPTTAPVTKVPNTTAPVTTVPVTKAPNTTAPVTTAPVTKTPNTTAPVTTAPVTKTPNTTAPVTTAPVTKTPNTTAPVTTGPVTKAPNTTAPVTASPVTKAPNTTAPVTTAPVTKVPETKAPVTTAPLPTAAVTAAPAGTVSVETAPVAKEPVKPAPVPTAAVTTAPVTTAPVPAGPSQFSGRQSC